MGFPIEVFTGSPDETFNLGKQICEYLKPGSVIALFGTLGSGKTCLAKGIASGLGITENLTSPTYTIINEYPLCGSGICAASTLYHIDVYRLKDDRDFEDLGGIEIIGSNGIVIIEWSERIPKSIPSDAIKVHLEIKSAGERVIRITGMDQTG